MVLTLIWLGGISIVELALWLPPLWRWRKVLACVVILPLSIISGLLVGLHFTPWSVLIMVLSVYRVINLLRLIEGRMQADYLFAVSRSSSLWLIGAQVLVLGGAGFNHINQLQPLLWLYGLAAVQFVLALVLLGSTLRHVRTTQPPLLKKHYADQDLPALTVAIPARNETDDLEACLQSLAQSTYSKLEILVLDDCSQNQRTPEIIRSFAQDGVRFIAGKPPPKQWLAKNYAYQQLSNEANGSLLLFCGVDTRFQANSLRVLVETLLAKKKTMLSIIPDNNTPSRWSIWPLLVQPGRYAWELALPRRALNRPPVLSTCWLITAEALHAAGSLKAVSGGHSPESYFARATIQQHDGYSFLASDANIGLASAKSFDEQRATAIRTRYPQLHRRPELVGLLSLIELTILIAPFGLLVGGIITQIWTLAALSGLTCLVLSAFYAKIVALTYRDFLLRGLWLLPLAAFYDIGLLNYSMWQYEFRQVIWKGRNICIPMMRVVPALPKLP